MSTDLLALEPTRPLRREEYDRLVEMGVFVDEKLELVEGRLVLMSPEGARHAKVVARIHRALLLALDGRAIIRTGAPLAVSDTSSPEPDVAAVPVDEGPGHPTTAFLVVEVSDSSLRKDSFIKPPLYAGAAVPEYWIVDLVADAVRVLRDPVEGGYASAASYGAGQSIGLVAFPDVSLAVSEILEG
ncbi:MAG: Uma2 family endonuclease [Sporichthyaceae bacterium]